MASSDEPKTLAEIWAKYEREVMPRDAGETQRRESRNCFYAGAAVLFSIIMRNMSAGDEPQPEDMELLDNLAAEIKAFELETVERAARARGGRSA
jgi:hypothetical protein